VIDFRRDWRQWAWMAIAVVAAFIIGFAWQGIRANQLDGRLGDTRQALTLHQLEGSLAAATLESQRDSYEIARQHASDFFTGLQGATEDAPSGVRAELEAMAGQRDQIITMLSRGDPAAADILSGMYSRYREIRIRAEQQLRRSG
jgi:hypothetical protein